MPDPLMPLNLQSCCQVLEDCIWSVSFWVILIMRLYVEEVALTSRKPPEGSLSMGML